MHEHCQEVYTEKEKTEAWTSVAKTVETYSDKMIERWIKEIDTYLVFVRSCVPRYSLWSRI